VKVSVEKRVVIEMDVDEATEFWQGYHPKPKTVGYKLDKALRTALDDAGAWDTV
jgi:hypothetical protein